MLDAVDTALADWAVLEVQRQEHGTVRSTSKLVPMTCPARRGVGLVEHVNGDMRVSGFYLHTLTTQGQAEIFGSFARRRRSTASATLAESS